MKRTRIGKISFDVISFENAINTISRIVENGTSCIQVVVANVFSIVLAEKDVEFNKICNSAEMVLPDGAPVVFFSRFFDFKLPQRIAGPDFMWEFSAVAAKKGYKMFLLGSKEPYLSNLQSNLQRTFSGIKVVGSYSPPFGPWSSEETEKMIRLINDSEADILWLGVSTPKQDKWIYSVKDRLRTKVAIAVGAAFDFHSGKVIRAPIWVQKVGFEWFHRLLQDPQRLWKRYLIGNIHFICIIFKQFMQKWLSSGT